MEHRVAIILPCYEACHFTNQVLGALLKYYDPMVRELFFLDNGSSDETWLILNSWGDRFRTLDNISCNILRNSGNVGFGPAVNQCIERVGKDITDICVFNNDILIRENWLYWLTYMMDKYENLGQASPFILHSPTLTEGAFETMELSHKNPGSEEIIFQRNTFPGNPWMFRKQVFDEIGVFDDRFVFGCYEDADIQIRMLRAGWEYIKVGNSPSFHYLHESMTSLEKKIGDQWSGVNWNRFFDKWGSESPDVPEFNLILRGDS